MKLPIPWLWISLVAAIRDGHWYWGLGDPDAGAVVVTGLYFLVAVVCLMAGRSARRGGEHRAWGMLAGMMFCLGVNKQADLQSLLTLYGRNILRDAGLYDARRTIQVVFIMGVMLAAGLISIMALWSARHWSWSCRFAAIGLGLQAAFVVIRAASFHHVDILLRTRLAEMKMNLLLESIGLMVMLLAALMAWAQGRVKAKG